MSEGTLGETGPNGLKASDMNGVIGFSHQNHIFPMMPGPVILGPEFFKEPLLGLEDSSKVMLHPTLRKVEVPVFTPPAKEPLLGLDDSSKVRLTPTLRKIEEPVFTLPPPAPLLGLDDSSKVMLVPTLKKVIEEPVFIYPE